MPTDGPLLPPKHLYFRASDDSEIELVGSDYGGDPRTGIAMTLAERDAGPKARAWAGYPADDPGAPDTN